MARFPNHATLAKLLVGALDRVVGFTGGVGQGPVAPARRVVVTSPGGLPLSIELVVDEPSLGQLTHLARARGLEVDGALGRVTREFAVSFLEVLELDQRVSVPRVLGAQSWAAPTSGFEELTLQSDDGAVRVVVRVHTHSGA